MSNLNIIFDLIFDSHQMCSKCNFSCRVTDCLSVCLSVCLSNFLIRYLSDYLTAQQSNHLTNRPTNKPQEAQALWKPFEFEFYKRLRHFYFLQTGEFWDIFCFFPIPSLIKFKFSKGFEPGSDIRSCSVIVRVRVVLKRTVVGDSD